jgi:hypothetical protein
MELHQRITNLVQKETDRLLKEFLNDNPDLLQKYVAGGVTAIGAVLTPLNAFMRHLLVVKGLDPDQEPGEKQRLALLEAVGSLFEKTHESDFDADYDFSWVQKKFEEARGHLKHLELTKDKFMDLTDISKLPSIGPGRYPTVVEEQEYFNQAPSTRLADKEIPVTNYGNTPTVSIPGGNAVTEEPVAQEYQNLRSALHEIIRGAGKAGFDPGEAIKKLSDVAQKAREITKKEVKKDAKTGIKTGKKKLNKGPDPKGPPAWGAKGVRVKRLAPTEADKLEHSAKKNTLKENIKIKFNRANDLVDDMVKRGLVTDSKEAKHEQVQQILLMDDDAVEALKRVVAKHVSLPGDNQFKGSFRRVQK